ncbi:tetratricopeptide repeat protein [Actinoallomurus spadix]|uniref:BTAD domain-containing putative transcriptional regulator n=1 Tax=Actinoallomurus spadix TaxID=79912 RepID=A0ABP3HA76_9ACTN|nr:BTAD domain-containing putative transcriptional regulator [Actinoallomurus spadix]MCO5988999.1 tetratricopeptide repeat protein [Actinoallomurus spadix]
MGGPVQERVLVCLLLAEGRVVPVPRLIEAVWAEDAPTTAAHQVRKAVAGLRRRIPGGPGLIVTTGPGYRTALRPRQLDLTIFTDLVRRAQQEEAAGRPAQAVAVLREALALWRGPVLDGTGGEVIAAASAVIEERRLAAIERFFELRLQSGESRELIGDLRDLVNAYPMQEALRAQLMLALYRSGRPAEALVEYERVRKLLAEELGVDPGDRLVTLYDAVLRNSPDLAPAPAAATATAPLGGGTPAAPSAVAPGAHRCTLPYDLPDFTGRAEELAQLVDHPNQPDVGHHRGPTRGPGWSPRIVAIDGMGGSGKTSLAVRVAHRLADHYPDAHLYVDLRGYTPGERPLRPGAVAGILLRMLEVPGEQIPEDLPGRLALWRSTVVRHRLLLLLDNVADSAQVLPLLPNSADTLVIITSRTRLVELDGAEWVSLGVMPATDSVAMITSMLGPDRAAREPEAVAELAGLCGHLPLALRIAGARLRNRPRWSVRYLVDRLRDETRRLDELRAGDRSVTATLSLSYDALDDEHRASFMLLSRHPGTDIDMYSAAALLGTDPAHAEDVLEHLLDTHLLQQYETSQYAFHDLVRSFAHWLRARDEAPDDHTGDAALTRLSDYYRAASDLACDLAFPGRNTTRSGPGPQLALPVLTDGRTARAWLHRELDSLVQVAVQAHAAGRYRPAAQLAHNAVLVLEARGRFEEFHQVATLGVECARALRDRSLLARGLSDVAAAEWRLGRLEDGLAATEESLKLAVALDDHMGEAKSTGTLGLLLTTLGRYREALPYLLRSIALKHELGAHRAKAASLVDLSGLHEQCGRYGEAADAARQAVEIDHRIGAWDMEAVALTDLAVAHLRLDQARQAGDCLDRVLELTADTAPVAEMSRVHALCATVRHRLGESAAAMRHAERALELDRGSRAPIRQAAVRNIVAGVYRAQGRYAVAADLHTEAHEIATRVGYRIEAARALAGLSATLRAKGDREAAETYRGRADEEFGLLGVPPAPSGRCA